MAIISLKGEDKQDIRVVTRVSFFKNSSAGRNVYGRELPEGNHDDHLTPGRLLGGFTA
jgi:hypothetical protein